MDASDQKKRALEALERRFALAKEQQQINSNKKRGIREVHEKVRPGGEAEEASPAFPGAGLPSKKVGNFTFSGAPLRKAVPRSSDAQVPDHPAYSELSQITNENLLMPDKVQNRGTGIVNQIVHNLLQHGDSAQKYMQGSRSMKIDNWFLLDNFVPSQLSSNAVVKALQSHSKRSIRHMSMKQHKKCGSLDLPQEFHRYDLFKPMHEMWKDYITKLIKDSGKNQISQRLLSADLHGAILLVVECKTNSFVGINGIMVRETRETFGLVAESDKFRVVPKKGSVFIFQAGNLKITLYGDKLSLREIDL